MTAPIDAAEPILAAAIADGTLTPDAAETLRQELRADLAACDRRERPGMPAATSFAASFLTFNRACLEYAAGETETDRVAWHAGIAVYQAYIQGRSAGRRDPR